MINVVELFAGIGSQTQALKNIGVPHRVVAVCEWDKYAWKSYKAIHCGMGVKTPNFGDIRKVEALPKADMWTYSFPCQDISGAGKQGGFKKGAGTKSSMLWEVDRLLDESPNPEILVMENVKALVGEKFIEDFAVWRKSLQDRGYRNYYQVLNAKDYSVPQNRDRVFMVSILGPGEPFSFPEKEELTLRLKDLLESDVDEKYYLSEEQVENYISNGNGNCNPSGKGMNGAVNSKNIANTLTTNKGEGPKILVRGNLQGPHEHSSRVYGVEGIAPTIHTMQGGGQEPKILEHLKNKTISRTIRCGGKGSLTVKHEWDLVAVKDNRVKIKEATKKGYAEAGPGDGISLEYPESNTRRGRVQRGLSATLQCNDNKGVVTKDLRVRKLTPRECFRLMDFPDEAFDKAAGVCSSSQLYKQAGNSIVVAVLERIFKVLFCEDKGNLQDTQMELF